MKFKPEDKGEKMNLELRVEGLERKINHLEQQLNSLLNNDKKAQWVPPVTANPSPEKITHLLKETPLDERKTEEQVVNTKDWEHLIARVWLPRIFIVVFLLGVLWGFTAAVNAGLITEPVRCMLGITAAGLMYWQGEAQIRRSRTTLGQVLLGGSIGVLILSLFAAHMLFELIPAIPAFILFVSSIGLSVFTALRHRSQSLMIISLFAGYLVPFLVDSSQANIWVFCGYEALFSITMILLSLRFSFRGAYYAAFGVLHLPLLFSLWESGGSESHAALITAVLLQHILLYAISTFYSKENSMDLQIMLYTSFGLLIAWMYGLYGGSGDRLTYEWMLAGSSILYSLTALWQYFQKRALSVTLSIATLGWLLWFIYVLHAEQASTAILIEAVIAICLGIKLNSKLQQITGITAYCIGIINVLSHPISDIFSPETLAWIALIGTLAGLYAFIKTALKDSKGKSEVNLTILWSQSVLVLIFISQLTSVFTEPLSFDYQHLILSSVWVFYAIIVIVIGLILNKTPIKLAGILFLMVALIKVIFLDLPDVSTAVRAILFIGLGAVGVGISRLFYKR
jgi:uncharacterized membrane protein